MKKILSIIAVLALAVNCFATGAQGVNPVQTGQVTFTGTTQSNTFAFPFAYQAIPVMQFYPNQTNGTPITNSLVTTTNFQLQIATAPGTGTNYNFTWVAYAGVPIIQFGTNSTMATVATNIPFPHPFAQLPVVQLTEWSTNGAASCAVTATTLTNFSVLCNTAAGFNWTAIGIGPLQNPTAFPVSIQNP